jgi:hypothetical protein
MGNDFPNKKLRCMATLDGRFIHGLESTKYIIRDVYWSGPNILFRCHLLQTCGEQIAPCNNGYDRFILSQQRGWNALKLSCDIHPSQTQSKDAPRSARGENEMVALWTKFNTVWNAHPRSLANVLLVHGSPVCAVGAGCSHA